MRAARKAKAATSSKQIAWLGKKSQWREALLLSPDRDADAAGFVATLACNACLGACGRGRQWRAALLLFFNAYRAGSEAWSLDAGSCSAALGSCRRGQAWQVAWTLVAGLLPWGFRADATTLGASVAAFDAAAAWREALAALARPQGGLEPDLITVASATSACGKCGAWLVASGLMATLREASGRPNEVALSSVASSLEEDGVWEMALRTLSEFAVEMLELDTTACTALVSVCREAVQWVSPSV
eukprot:TRINITY_DN25225_c0_g2_i3.p2 TRINITY_DN25225_c0_g2~~TRINITY_DN25225_c0_g2_i3.p2  ORF type:complete len:244 (+),score=35.11 TRINITY_DN25225_c0_g2_i3:98-829(+)